MNLHGLRHMALNHMGDYLTKQAHGFLFRRYRVPVFRGGYVFDDMVYTMCTFSHSFQFSTGDALLCAASMSICANNRYPFTISIVL